MKRIGTRLLVLLLGLSMLAACTGQEPRPVDNGTPMAQTPTEAVGGDVTPAGG